jgi:Flp pilus assembly pilin Flp
MIISGGVMLKLKHAILKLKIWTDMHGQDLVEYALMAGFVAVSAGAIMPGVANKISAIFSSISVAMSKSSSQGS